MNKFDLIMISTHQNDVNIYKLLQSIDNNILNINLLLILISQDTVVNFNPKSDMFKIIILEDSKMGLSKARNIGLKHLVSNDITCDFIMFPDDDSTFDINFFKSFPEILKTNNCYITPIYNEGTRDFYIGVDNESDFKMKLSNLRLVGSPNQILPYEQLKNKIYFDEKLGVGGLYGSSEDMDLFVRLSLGGQIFYYTAKCYSFHPKKISNYKNKPLIAIVKRFISYSEGFAFVLFKYKLYSFIPEYLIRTLVASVIFLLKFDIKLSAAYLLQFFARIYFLIFFCSKRELS